jgi:neutral ceramidase
MIVYKNGQIEEVPFDGPLVTQAALPGLCARTMLQPGYECQLEKPVLGAFSPEPAPFQIFRLGNLAVLGVPWEVTTMAARRLRAAALDLLAPVGIDTVVIAGLSNAYLDYLATREEYSAQMYEGASTSYGPWQLAAAQQEIRRLAQSLAAGAPAPEGVPPPSLQVGDPSPVTTDLPAQFGATLVEAQDAYTQGDEVAVSWVAGYPGNDLKTMSSYLFVEREVAPAGWQVVATDRDPELLFLWHSSPNLVTTVPHVSESSSVEARWRIPANAAAGRYRIRYEGVSRSSASAAPVPHAGASRAFDVSGTPARCR